MGRKTILVTGANGYIGRHVVKACLERGCRVIASDVERGGIDERAEFLPIPIFSGAEDIYAQCGRPDALIHLAWKDGFGHNSAAHMGLLSDHVTFLNHMIDGGLPQLSVMGSMHEVGYWEGAIDENTPCKPLSQYGVAKNALRQSLLLYAKGKATSVRWLRAYYIFGDDIRGASIFAKIVAAAQRGDTEFPFTSGKNKYDFIEIDELARQIVAATIQKRYEGIINVCTGKPKTLAEQVEAFIADHGFHIQLNYGAFPDRPYDSPGVWGDADIIRRIMKEEGHGQLDSDSEYSL